MPMAIYSGIVARTRAFSTGLAQIGSRKLPGFSKYSRLKYRALMKNPRLPMTSAEAFSTNLALFRYRMMFIVFLLCLFLPSFLTFFLG